MPTFERVRERLAQRLRDRREHLGLSQETVATAAALSLRHYQRLEAGEGNPSLETICTLASVLKLRLLQLLG